MTKVAVAIGLLGLTCFALPMGAMRLAEAVDEEEALYQEIQTVSNFRPDELLPRPGVQYGGKSDLEKYQQNWERGLELCEQFLNAYPDSERYDSVWYEKLNYLFGLQRNAEFDAGAEAFLSERPGSKYTGRLRRFRVYRFMDEFKFDQALAELDKINDPAMLPEVYQRKADVHAKMDNGVEEQKFMLLWTELILGKPAPEFSHTSVDGVPVSLQALRGKVVVLYHWSTGDESAQWQVPILKRLHEMHGENPNFVLITVCTRSIKAELKQFVETHAMPGIHLLLEPERVPYQFGVIPLLKYLPGYVLLDKTGIIRVSEHTFSRGDFKFDHLITALLAEDPNADGERIIPQVNQFLANSYLVKNQTEKSIAEYEKMLAFTPNNLDIMMDIFNLKMFPSAETALMNRAYNRMLELNQLDQLSPELDVNIRYHILELVDLFAERGDREKTWTLFQVAVVHDDSAINHARQHKKRFAVIQDIPEFQKLLAETPQSEAERRSNELRRKREMYAEDLRAAHQSFTAVEADGEIFTGTILSQAGYILVPASVARAEVIRSKLSIINPPKLSPLTRKANWRWCR